MLMQLQEKLFGNVVDCGEDCGKYEDMRFKKF